jgi:diguanylate cyclase (GGDEF)-like protein
MMGGPGTRGGNGLDLTTAVRILHHAGRPDPMQLGGDPRQQLQSLIDSLCDLTIHDGLTGLVNASFFQAALTREMDRSTRTGRSCGLLLLDIDHFKLINDERGHLAGDCVLQSFAQTLKQSMRVMDTAARTGGDEFAIILPECTPEDAVHAATRIHRALSPLEVAVEDAAFTVTASAGLAWTDLRPILRLAEFVSLADQEMYRAKQLGRNRLCHPVIAALEVSAAERASLFPRRAKEESDGR